MTKEEKQLKIDIDIASKEVEFIFKQSLKLYEELEALESEPWAPDFNSKCEEKETSLKALLGKIRLESENSFEMETRLKNAMRKRQLRKMRKKN